MAKSVQSAIAISPLDWIETDWIETDWIERVLAHVTVRMRSECSRKTA
jgi:hypothetical protein